MQIEYVHIYVLKKGEIFAKTMRTLNDNYGVRDKVTY